jgi:hypothetical protein
MQLYEIRIVKIMTLCLHTPIPPRLILKEPNPLQPPQILKISHIGRLAQLVKQRALNITGL